MPLCLESPLLGSCNRLFSLLVLGLVAKCDEDQLFWNLFLHTSVLKYISLTKTAHQPRNSLRPLLPVSF